MRGGRGGVRPDACTGQVSNPNSCRFAVVSRPRVPTIAKIAPATYEGGGIGGLPIAAEAIEP